MDIRNHYLVILKPRKDLNRFEELGEIIEEIYKMIYYYKN